MVEDDPEITDLLSKFLEKHNMRVSGFETPSCALNSLKIDKYDLIILDLSLPEMDGLELCKMIRQTSQIPIIISTARGDLTDKVMGLELGADDYIPKPYEPRELAARIKSVLRRYNPNQSNDNKIFSVNEEKMQIFKNDKILDLTLAEYEILHLLIQKRGMVISRNFIANNVDAIRWDSGERSIDVIVARIRKKIEKDPKNPEFIKSIRGVGYKFLG